MIYVGENKSILCKGDFRPAQLYKGDKKITGYTVEKFEGTGSVTLENCYNDRVYDVYVDESTQSITVRGKNYFSLDKVLIFNAATQPYNNGLKVQKTGTDNRSNKIPVSLPAGKTINVTMEVVDSQIDGTETYITLCFYNSEGTKVTERRVSSSATKKSFSFTPNKEISYFQFIFQANITYNAVGDYVTMDNIMIRTEGDDSFEPYIEPQTIPLENGELTAEIPTFKGTTVIEAEATISGKYKKREVE
ncbi:MAG: hypothetical protein IJX50_01425 [Clostridia bacterium]|nr:hypothetical protein [Clostridia bacterium]